MWTCLGGKAINQCAAIEKLRRHFICFLSIARVRSMLWSVYMEHLQPSQQQRMERFGSVEINPAVTSFVQRKSVTSFEMALASFQASSCPEPVCHIHQKLPKMRDIKNNGNDGRPFFVCSDQENPCSFWQWEDVVESPKPLCSHGLTSRVRKVKKDGPDQACLFYCCPNNQANSCGFFGWKPVENLQRAYKTVCLFSSPSGLYLYKVKDTSEIFSIRKTDSEEAYKDFLLQQSVNSLTENMERLDICQSDMF